MENEKKNAVTQEYDIYYAGSVDAIEKAIKKTEKKLGDLEEKCAWKEAEIREAQANLDNIKAEIKEMDEQRVALAKELEWYVKEKLDIKERKDTLDAKEKYLRKRYEEAWIKF